MLFGLLLNLLRVLVAPFWVVRRLVMRRRPVWVHLRLDHRVLELRPVQPRWRRWLPNAAREIVLEDLRELSRSVGKDPNVRGVVIDIPHTMSAGWSALVGLRQVLDALRVSGKRVVAYLPDGGSTRELYVALGADTIWTAPEATLALLGIAGESMYVKPLLDRIGISVEVHAAGRFKTAAEPLVADEMSDAQREQRRALLDSLQHELVESLRRSRRLDDAAIERALSEVMFRGSAAVAAGLADDVCYADQVIEKLGLLSGEGVTQGRAPRLVSENGYRRTFMERAWRQVLPRPYIAIVPVHGTIGLNASPQGGGANVAAVSAALDLARRDPRALAVVLHVDSPGGSALASDHIHREVVRLARTKPVVACFGDVAASGGYYVAAPARRIVAQSTTVTGSIGVISAKVVLSGLFARFGVKPQVLTTAPHADMFSFARGLDPAEHAIMEREAQGLYRTFLGIVADGRGRPVEEIEVLAGGRVWSGRDALSHGLVDRLGGLDVALDEARGLLEKLPVQARARLQPRVITSFARTRMLPSAPESDVLAFRWLSRLWPEITALFQLQTSGEQLLLWAPWAQLADTRELGASQRSTVQISSSIVARAEGLKRP